MIDNVTIRVRALTSMQSPFENQSVREPHDEIAAAARTVAHLAGYFQELKQQAVDLRTRIDARTRGYFTPREDEQVRQLLVSYWKARNALVELVSSLHDAELDEQDRDPAFLVTYAGAIVLVDGARFLRDTFDDSPIARQKFNEPEPAFGIPAGTYDQVQYALSRPLHAWYLWRGTRYYEAREQELAELERDPVLAPVFSVIHRSGDCVKVTPTRFLKTLTQVRARGITTDLGQNMVGQATYRMQRAVSSMISELSVRPGHRPGVPAEIHRQLAQLARPGDVFIVRKQHAVTNYFLPGYWPHAALYLGDAAALSELGLAEHENFRPRWERLLNLDVDQPGRVLEAMKDGVLLRSITSPLASDAVTLIRPLLSREEIAQALARGMFHEGKPYDFDFDFTRSDRLVCTEVVYRSYDGVGPIRFELSRRAGRLTLAAVDLLRMALVRSMFETVAVYCPERDARLVSGAEADRLLAATLPAAV